MRQYGLAYFFAALAVVIFPAVLTAQVRERFGLTRPTPRLSPLGGYYGYFPTSWRPWPANGVSIPDPQTSHYSVPVPPARPAWPLPTPLPQPNVAPARPSNPVAITGQATPAGSEVSNVPNVSASGHIAPQLGWPYISYPPGNNGLSVSFPGQVTPTRSNIRIRVAETDSAPSDDLLPPPRPSGTWGESGNPSVPESRPDANTTISSPRRILRIHVPEEEDPRR